MTRSTSLSVLPDPGSADVYKISGGTPKPWYCFVFSCEPIKSQSLLFNVVVVTAQCQLHRFPFSAAKTDALPPWQGLTSACICLLSRRLSQLGVLPPRTAVVTVRRSLPAVPPTVCSAPTAPGELTVLSPPRGRGGNEARSQFHKVGSWWHLVQTNSPPVYTPLEFPIFQEAASNTFIVLPFRCDMFDHFTFTENVHCSRAGGFGSDPPRATQGPTCDCNSASEEQLWGPVYRLRAPRETLHESCHNRSFHVY